MRLARPVGAALALALLLVPVVALSANVSAAQAAKKKKCVQIGVYQDKPGQKLKKLQKRVGPVGVLSTYLTGGKLLKPSLIELANKRKLVLMVAWMPDSGADGANQKKFRLGRISQGTYDASLKALT